MPMTGAFTYVRPGAAPAPAAKAYCRLQKRQGPSRENSGAWPLPEPANSPDLEKEEAKRPFTADTADGVAGGELTNGNRPDIGTRRFTATGVADVDMNGVGKPKKKKFPTLRRMFRLDY